MDNDFYKPSYLYQYKPEPVKGSSINTILIFSMADASGCSSYISGSKRSQSIIKIQDLTKSHGKVHLYCTLGACGVLREVRAC